MAAVSQIKATEMYMRVMDQLMTDGVTITPETHSIVENVCKYYMHTADGFAVNRNQMHAELKKYYHRDVICGVLMLFDVLKDPNKQCFDYFKKYADALIKVKNEYYNRRQ